MQDDNGNGEPALSLTSIAGLIAGTLVLILTRGNRGLDWLNSGELDQAKSLVALGAPVLAGILIRRKVTPTSKVAAIVETARGEAALAKEQEINSFLNEVAVGESTEPVQAAAKRARGPKANPSSKT